MNATEVSRRCWGGIAALTLVAAACSSGSSGSSGSSDSSDSSEKTTSPESTRAAAAPPSCPKAAQGKILAMSDADMVATGYTDFQLGPPARTKDALTVIDPAGTKRPPSVGVSNAVTGPVWVIDTSTDRRFAFVVETTKPNDGTLKTFQQLLARQGDRLTTIDLCARGGPSVVGTSTTGVGPVTVSVAPDGSMLAVAHRTGKGPAGVVLHPLKNGKVGKPKTLRLPKALLGTAQEVTGAIWSPDGSMLAVAVRDTRRLGFFRRDTTSGKLSPWGDLVSLDEGTFGGVWSPDGRFFYVNNVRAGARPIDLTPDPSTLGDFVGTVQVVQVGDRTAGRAARHKVIQKENTPIFPEGIAVSPDGSLLATVNQQASALPPSAAFFSPTSTVSLWTRDKASGRLKKAADYPFEGILPEGASFDPTSRRLAVAVYHLTNANRTIGGVDIWAIERSKAGAPTLTRKKRIPVRRGVHEVRWIR